MSAFVVSKPHIDALVCAAVGAGFGHGSTPMRWFDVDPDTLPSPTSWEDHQAQFKQHVRHATTDRADDIGRMLWQANVDSVKARYPDSADDDLPGPVDFKAHHAERYVYPLYTKQRPPVAILKALAGYEYQACETPDWHKSEAYQFCQALRLEMIRRLPGYDEADWEIDD